MLGIIPKWKKKKKKRSDRSNGLVSVQNPWLVGQTSLHVELVPQLGKQVTVMEGTMTANGYEADRVLDLMNEVKAQTEKCKVTEQEHQSVTKQEENKHYSEQELRKIEKEEHMKAGNRNEKTVNEKENEDVLLIVNEPCNVKQIFENENLMKCDFRKMPKIYRKKEIKRLQVRPSMRKKVQETKLTTAMALRRIVMRVEDTIPVNMMVRTHLRFMRYILRKAKSITDDDEKSSSHEEEKMSLMRREENEEETLCKKTPKKQTPPPTKTPTGYKKTHTHNKTPTIPAKTHKKQTQTPTKTPTENDQTHKHNKTTTTQTKTPKKQTPSPTKTPTQDEKTQTHNKTPTKPTKTPKKQTPSPTKKMKKTPRTPAIAGRKIGRVQKAKKAIEDRQTQHQQDTAKTQKKTTMVSTPSQKRRRDTPPPARTTQRHIEVGPTRQKQTPIHHFAIQQTLAERQQTLVNMKETAKAKLRTDTEMSSSPMLKKCMKRHVGPYKTHGKQGKTPTTARKVSLLTQYFEQEQKMPGDRKTPQLGATNKNLIFDPPWHAPSATKPVSICGDPINNLGGCHMTQNTAKTDRPLGKTDDGPMRETETGQVTRPGEQ